MARRITRAILRRRLRTIHREDMASLSILSKDMETSPHPSNPLLRNLGMDIKEDTTKVLLPLRSSSSMAADMVVTHPNSNPNSNHNRTTTAIHPLTCLHHQARRHSNLAMGLPIATPFNTVIALESEKPF